MNTSKTFRRLAAVTSTTALGISMLGSTASAQIFTDRAAFQAALGAFTVETFETTPLIGTEGGGSIPSLSLSYFTITASPSAIKVFDTPAPYAAFNTTPGGSRYLYLDTDRGFQGTLATFQFDSPLLAFGFDYTSHEAWLFCQLAGPTFTLPATSGPTDSRFWGFISASPFSTVSLDSNAISAYGIDQITFAMVPEPSAASLLLMGLSASAVFARNTINRNINTRPSNKIRQRIPQVRSVCISRQWRGAAAAERSV